jgi:hypothetical protein
MNIGLSTGAEMDLEPRMEATGIECILLRDSLTSGVSGNDFLFFFGSEDISYVESGVGVDKYSGLNDLTTTRNEADDEIEEVVG